VPGVGTSPGEGCPRASAYPRGPDSHHPISPLHLSMGLPCSDLCRPGWECSCRGKRGVPPSLPSLLRSPRRLGQGGEDSHRVTQGPHPLLLQAGASSPATPDATPVIASPSSPLLDKEPQAPEAGGFLILGGNEKIEAPRTPPPHLGSSPSHAFSGTGLLGRLDQTQGHCAQDNNMLKRNTRTFYHWWEFSNEVGSSWPTKGGHGAYLTHLRTVETWATHGPHATNGRPRSQKMTVPFTTA